LNLATDETLAGRILLYFNGEAPRLIPQGDAGFAASTTA
jgi:hypothetical protein